MIEHNYVAHEREVAIYDILDGNHFVVDGRDEGPYTLNLSIVEDRLVFAIGTPEQPIVFTVVLSLATMRKTIKDYFLVCDSYYQAIRTAPPRASIAPASRSSVRATPFTWGGHVSVKIASLSPSALTGAGTGARRAATRGRAPRRP